MGGDLALPVFNPAYVGCTNPGNPGAHAGWQNKTGHFCAHATWGLPELYLPGVGCIDADSVYLERQEIVKNPLGTFFLPFCSCSFQIVLHPELNDPADQVIWNGLI
jgi:hypothetical protein